MRTLLNKSRRPWQKKEVLLLIAPLLVLGLFLGLTLGRSTFYRYFPRTLQGHLNPVNCLAFSPHGKLLATGSGAVRRGGHPWKPGGVRVWNAETGQPLWKRQGASTLFTEDVAFAPDGQTLASAGGTFIELWDARAGQLLRALKTRSSVNELAFSPDGQVLACGGSLLAAKGRSDQAVLQLWNPQTGHLLRTMPRPGYWLKAVAFSPNSKVVAVVSHFETHKIRPNKSGVGGLVELDAAAKRGSQLDVLDATSGQVRKTLRTTSIYETIKGIAFSPDGKTLACISTILNAQSAITGGTLRLVDAQSGAVKWTRHKPFGKGATGATSEASTESVAFSSNGRLLATGEVDNAVRVWNARTGQVVRTLQGGRSSETVHPPSPETLAFSPDGKLLASRAGNVAKLWDVNGL